jgi:hypothetical protein
MMVNDDGDGDANDDVNNDCEGDANHGAGGGNGANNRQLAMLAAAKPATDVTAAYAYTVINAFAGEQFYKLIKAGKPRGPRL